MGSCPSDLVWLSKLKRLLVFLLRVLLVYAVWVLWGLIRLRVDRIVLNLNLSSFGPFRYPKAGSQ